MQVPTLQQTSNFYNFPGQQVILKPYFQSSGTQEFVFWGADTNGPKGPMFTLVLGNGVKIWNSLVHNALGSCFGFTVGWFEATAQANGIGLKIHMKSYVAKVHK
jgi:hypothetical protein